MNNGSRLCAVINAYLVAPAPPPEGPSNQNPNSQKYSVSQAQQGGWAGVEALSL